MCVATAVGPMGYVIVFGVFRHGQHTPRALLALSCSLSLLFVPSQTLVRRNRRTFWTPLVVAGSGHLAYLPLMSPERTQQQPHQASVERQIRCDDDTRGHRSRHGGDDRTKDDDDNVARDLPAQHLARFFGSVGGHDGAGAAESGEEKEEDQKAEEGRGRPGRHVAAEPRLDGSGDGGGQRKGVQHGDDGGEEELPDRIGLPGSHLRPRVEFVSRVHLAVPELRALAALGLKEGVWGTKRHQWLGMCFARPGCVQGQRGIDMEA